MLSLTMPSLAAPAIVGVVNGTYPIANTIYCVDTASLGVCNLYRNDTNITAVNNTAITDAAGVWNYSTITNNDGTGSWTMLIVNQKAFTYSLSPSTQTVTYEGSVTQYAASNDTTGASSLTLWRNGTNITASDLNGTSEVLPTGVWVYWANSTFNPANYSYTNQTSTITVNQKAFTLALLPATQKITYGTSLLQQGTSNDTTANVTFWRNVTNMTAAVPSLNDTSETLGAGVWVFWLNSSLESANYSYTNQNTVVTVNQKAFTFTLSPTTQSITYETSLLQQGLSNDTVANVTFWRNSTNITTTINASTEILPPGYWVYWLNSSLTGSNYSYINTTSSITVNKAGLSLTLSPGTMTSSMPTINLYCTVNSTSLLGGLGTLWWQGGNITSSNGTTSTPGVGTYTLGCNVTAPDANYSYTNQSSTLTVTAAAAAASTSSGSASTASTSATTLTISSLLAGVPKVINEVSLPYDAKLTSIQLTTNTAATAVQMAVQSYASKPSDVATAAAPDIYKYVSVSFTNLAANNVQTAKIAFKVEKSWLTLKGLSANDVALYRYTGGAWTVLSTSKTSEDGIYAYYQATTPGFSYFAIGGQASTSATTTTTLPAAGQTTTTTVPGIATTTTIASAGTTPADYTWILVIGIVAVAAFALVLKFKPFGIGGKAWNKY
ncbi:MAG: PGF-pre-PGF domain-containing protein [Candidatus Aenigmarchaeota archaeon]|nr:PGF-pre-PGF domain-containing protein [Candidatus Aenigmarchaeota archaeon]